MTRKVVEEESTQGVDDDDSVSMVTRMLDGYEDDDSNALTDAMDAAIEEYLVKGANG